MLHINICPTFFWKKSWCTNGLKTINVRTQIMVKSKKKPKVQIILLDPLPINLYVHFRSVVVICEYSIKVEFSHTGWFCLMAKWEFRNAVFIHKVDFKHLEPGLCLCQLSTFRRFIMPVGASPNTFRFIIDVYWSWRQKTKNNTFLLYLFNTLP